MGVSFKKKKFWVCILYYLFLYSLGRWVDEGINNEANYQEYEYDVYFLQGYTSTVIHIMNGEGVS